MRKGSESIYQLALGRSVNVKWLKGHLYKYTSFCRKTGYVVIMRFLLRDVVCQMSKISCTSREICSISSTSCKICSISCTYPPKPSKKYRSGVFPSERRAQISSSLMMNKKVFPAVLQTYSLERPF